MARFECKCGEVLSNTSSPNEIEYHVYSDKEWDGIINQEIIDPINIIRPKYQVWKCPVCERVYIFDGDDVIKIYTLEK